MKEKGNITVSVRLQVITDNLKPGTKSFLSNEVLTLLKITLDGFSRAIKIMSESLEKQHWTILWTYCNADLEHEFEVAAGHWGYSHENIPRKKASIYSTSLVKEKEKGICYIIRKF